MKINVDLNGTKLVLQLEGRLDTTTAPELEDTLERYNDEITDLTLDFAPLDYISSAGLRVLLSEQKLINKKNGSMVVINVNDTIMEVFEITGFTDVINIQ